MSDAVVIGSGPNGLVAANLLADAGWDVTVLEAAAEPGGAVRSAELMEPGFVNDRFSAFYPLGAVSPHLRKLHLEDHGLRWRTGHIPVAHPASDGTCPAISLDLEETVEILERESGAGDGAAWRELYEFWCRARPGILGALFSPLPALRPAARIARDLSVSEILRLTRLGLLPVRRMGEEIFSGEGAPRLLAGNALHADLSPEMPVSGVIGWLLCSLAQQVGFPVPEGGAGELTRALVRRLHSLGGELRTNCRAERIELRRGRVAAVHAGGGRFPVRRAVIADTAAPFLYEQLLEGYGLGACARADLRRFHWDSASCKVDWNLDAPIPWQAPLARRAGTVHVAESMDALTRQAASLACGEIPAHPYLVMGQYAALDPSRAPAGRETAWAYTHLPHPGRHGASSEHLSADALALLVDRMEEEVEALAPGFRRLIRARHVRGPRDLQAENANLEAGALNGGTIQLHQQLVFRPIPGLGRAETPAAGVFLGSSAAHPGGGVHGAPGANAARAALRAAAGRPGARLALAGVRALSS